MLQEQAAVVCVNVRSLDSIGELQKVMLHKSLIVSCQYLTAVSSPSTITLQHDDARDTSSR